MAGVLLCQDMAGGSGCHRASVLWSCPWPPPPLHTLYAPPSAHTGANSGAGSSLGGASPSLTGGEWVPRTEGRKEGGEGKQTEDKRLVVGREQEAGRLGVEGASLIMAWWRNAPEIIPQSVCVKAARCWQQSPCGQQLGPWGTPASVGTTGPAGEREPQGPELSVFPHLLGQ